MTVPIPMMEARRRALEKLTAARKRYQAALTTDDEDAKFHARAALRQAEARWGREWQKEQRWYH
jgi:hypothetical protein